MKVVKSPIILQKEKELKTLQKKQKKILTQVKRFRTTLENMQNDITNIQRKTSSGIFMELLDVKKRKDEVIELLKQAQKSKKLSRADRREAKEMLKEIEELDLLGGMEMPFSWEELEDKINNPKIKTDEFDRSRVQDMFKGFRVELEKDEEKNIRKLYVQLANRFHPDKAKTETERATYHDVMQKIVAAKDRGDYALLQSIEKEYTNSTLGMPVEANEASVVIDILDEQIAKVRLETQQLERQLDRLKQEVANLKASELGAILKQEREAQRWGGMTTDDAVEDVADLTKQLTSLRDELTYLLEHGEFRAEYLEEIKAEAAMMKEAFSFDFDLFDDEDEEEDEDDERFNKEYKYEEKTGKFYTPDYTKQELAQLNISEYDDPFEASFENDDFHIDPSMLPPDILELQQKLASGKMTQEELIKEMQNLLKKRFGG